jgi:hypothetical protein
MLSTDALRPSPAGPASAERCLICRRLLDDPSDPIRSANCGGDCLQCMADSGDTDCIAEMAKIEPERYHVDQ